MSTIFSDPGWRRGTTLLGAEPIEYVDPDTQLVPIAGRELAGQVKIFQDVDPSSGKRKSNRLVYCVAARYKGASTLDKDAGHAGKFVVFSDTNPLAEFAQFADQADVDAGKAIGVLDEYLTVDVRKDDIVWVVVKGPAAPKKTGASVTAGASISLPATANGGAVAATGAGQTQIAQALEAADGAAASVRVNVMSNHL